MRIKLRIRLSKIFGVGSIQGSAGTLQRYLSQTDNGGGTIRINGVLKSLSESELELSSYLSIDVSGSKIINSETNSDPDIGDWFTLEINL